MTNSIAFDRRNFLSLAGKGLGLAALSSATVASLLKEIQAATKSVAHLTPEQAAMDEDYWSVIQNAFSVTRGIINLNNGGVSPSPRIVTEALVRYIWQQEDATAYTMWQLLEPQSETIRTGLAEVFGCDREEIAITRNASESLEILLMGMDFKSGDEILTTTQDYPRMLTTLRQREKREGLVLKLIKIPIPPKSLSEITAAFERGITSRTRLILIMHQVNLTGQITPVKAVCEMARARSAMACFFSASMMRSSIDRARRDRWMTEATCRSTRSTASDSGAPKAAGRSAAIFSRPISSFS